MKRIGSAVWQGDIQAGKGRMSSQSGALKDTPYGFKSRFGEEPGTNPEELIGAAHAGCFSMALSLMLGEAGHTPERIETRATVSLEKRGDGFEISAVHLTVKAKVPALDSEGFSAIAAKAKDGCPVSKLFKGASITLDASLDA